MAFNCTHALTSFARHWLRYRPQDRVVLVSELLKTGPCDNVCDLSTYRKQVHATMEELSEGSANRVLALKPRLGDLLIVEKVVTHHRDQITTTLLSSLSFGQLASCVWP